MLEFVGGESYYTFCALAYTASVVHRGKLDARSGATMTAAGDVLYIFGGQVLHCMLSKLLCLLQLSTAVD